MLGSPFSIAPRAAWLCSIALARSLVANTSLLNRTALVLRGRSRETGAHVAPADPVSRVSDVPRLRRDVRAPRATPLQRGLERHDEPGLLPPVRRRRGATRDPGRLPSLPEPVRGTAALLHGDPDRVRDAL